MNSPCAIPSKSPYAATLDLSVALLGTQKYGCVRQLYFLRTSIDRNPKYLDALARSQSGSWWIDIGTAFGQDVRLPVLDGWPANRMLASGEAMCQFCVHCKVCMSLIGSKAQKGPDTALRDADLIPDLWEAGLGLYPNSQNIKFVTANVLDPSPSAERLGAYQGAAEVVSSNLVFHTLSKEGVDGMLSAIMSLLVPGGLVLGACAACREARKWTEYDPDRWLHSPQTLRDAFEKAGFEQVVIEPFDLPEGHGDHGKIGIGFSGFKPSSATAKKNSTA